MSLLEDIFLQDEANEAQQLERVIEGDEFDEHPRSIAGSDSENDGGNREDEAEEDKRRVDPSSTKTKKVVKNPRFVLNPARLTGPRGIQVIPDHFKDFKFKGKGHEKDDVDMVLKKLEHWAYRLYPKFQFEDCLKKIESLGRKRPVMVHLHKIRTDQHLSEDTVVQKDSSDDEAQQEPDEFDKLLQQQIDLARATPGPGSVKKAQRDVLWERVLDTPGGDSSLSMPKATSSPSISDEQKERMLQNRKLAEERRLARLKQSLDNNTSHANTESFESSSQDNTKTASLNVVANNKRTNRSNVIDSSDSEEDNRFEVTEPVIVDIHHNGNNCDDKDIDKTEHDDKNSHEGVDSTEEIIVVEKNSHETVDSAEEMIVVEKNSHETVDSAEEKIVVEKNSHETVESTEEMIVVETNTQEAIDSAEKMIAEDINSDRNDKIDISDPTTQQNTVNNTKESDCKNKRINNENDIHNRIKEIDTKYTETNIATGINDNNIDSIENNGINKDKIDNFVDNSNINNQNDIINSVNNTNESSEHKESTEDLQDVMDIDFSDDF